MLGRTRVFFLLEVFYLIRDKICDQIFCLLEENQLRYGMRLPSPRRGPGRLSLGPPPHIPPFQAKMLKLNWLQRLRKVF